MGKHAYLIMAHGDWSLLSKLLMCLDDSRNTIYIHIDKKSDFNESDVYELHNAKCQYVNRLSVSWGGYSQIAVELELLEVASAGGYDYYHLLSGQDLPIKSQSYIHEFFDCQTDLRSYIEAFSGPNFKDLVDIRLGQYHFFQDSIGRNPGRLVAALYILEKKVLLIQKQLGVNRVSKIPFKIYKGANWFSISNEIAQYVISQKRDIERWFKRSLCADELFLQSIIMDSPYAGDIVFSSLRETDWKRGKPYTYRKEDYDMLMKSDALFARKFSSDCDAEIIDMICNTVLDEQRLKR